MKFRRSIGWSLAGHVAILALAIFGLPNIREHKVEPIESIAIDVVDFSDAPQRAGEKAAPKSPEIKQKQVEKPAAETPQPKPEPKPKEVTAPAPTPPKVQPKPEPEVKPQPKPEPKVEPKPQEKFDPDALMKKINEAQKPKEQPKEQPKEEPKPQKPVEKPAEKPAAKPQPTPSESTSKPTQTQTSTSNFDPTKISQLLNKEKPTASAGQGVVGKPQEATQGAPKGLGAKLTQSQYAALQGMIREQVSKCWSPPAGGGGADIKVKLEIAMNPDGSLSGMPQVTNSSNDPNFRPVAESAVRAVRRCAPLKLPADQYNSENGWKEIEFIFDPSQI